jgi:hypothetical protein
MNLHFSFRRTIRATVAATVSLVLKKGHTANRRNTKTHSPHMPYNPPSSFSRFALFFSPKESKCSKWWNSNFINNQTLLILFILFHNCWNLQMCWMCGCAFEKKLFSLLASVSREQPVATRVYNRHFSCIRSSKLPNSKFISP